MRALSRCQSDTHPRSYAMDAQLATYPGKVPSQMGRLLSAQAQGLVWESTRCLKVAYLLV